MTREIIKGTIVANAITGKVAPEPMTEPLSYHVFTASRGGLWLGDDEQSWTRHFHDSAAFTSEILANAIGNREAPKDEPIYVLACMPTMSEET